jgi:hypothetical protein
MTNSWSLLYEEMMNNNDEDKIILNDDPLDKLANETYDQFSSTFTDTLTAHITSTTLLEVIRFKLLILLKPVVMGNHSVDPISSSTHHDTTRRALPVVIS